MVASASRLTVIALGWAVAGCTHPAVREFADLASTASAEFELVTGDMQASQVATAVRIAVAVTSGNPAGLTSAVGETGTIR